MAFGKLRKFWEKVKDVGKKVWGGIKKVGQVLMPVAKAVAPAVANAFAPGSGMAVSAGLGVADDLFNEKWKQAGAGAVGMAIQGKIRQIPSTLIK
jgi:hypothetical protein